MFCSALLGFFAAGGLRSGWSSFIRCVSASPAVRNVQLTFQPTGACSISGSVGFGGTAPSWYDPVMTGVGSGWSVRYVPGTLSNTTISGMAANTWYSIGAGITFTATNTGSAVEGTGTATIQFSPDGGTTAITLGTLTWDVGTIV